MDDNPPTLYYTTANKSQIINYTVVNEDGTTSLRSVTREGEKDSVSGQYFIKNIKFKIENDCLGNYKLFKIEGNKLKRKVS
jgi:hypothetical protein